MAQIESSKQTIAALKKSSAKKKKGDAKETGKGKGKGKGKGGGKNKDNKDKKSASEWQKQRYAEAPEWMKKASTDDDVPNVDPTGEALR